MTTNSLDDLVHIGVTDPEADAAPVALLRSRPDGGSHNGKAEPRNLSFREARDAPCLSCQSSPCCTHLLLADFKLEHLLDVDYAQYLLNFEGIYLGLGQDMKVDVYLYQACGFLGDNGLCGVHSTPAQPAVCISYKSQSCGYRRRMTVDVDPVRPLLDRRRLDWVAERMVFDDERRLLSGPEWDEIIEAFGYMPLQRSQAPVPGPDPVREEWRAITLGQKPAPGSEAHRYGDAQVSHPCDGCGAWCCSTLVFNRGVPVNASQLDFLRYCLGFPSVEVGVSEDGWAVIVHTTCRNLDQGRCSVYGSDERPLRCGYYDALACDYRTHFGTPEPADIVRVGLDQFQDVAESIVFDENGMIRAIPPMDVLRGRLGGLLRARTAAGSQVTEQQAGEQQAGEQQASDRQESVASCP